MTPDIRELLEDAARAMGISVTFTGKTCWIIQGDYLMGLWNPLESLADRARMEDALELHVAWLTDSVIVEKHNTERRTHCAIEYFDDHNNDRSAAHSMASLRVAAEIGRGKK